jgi:anti-sigma factor RsiW
MSTPGPIDCEIYAEQYLSAQADGELTPDELRTAEEHLRSCERCEAALARERELKTMVRSSAGVRKMPGPIESRIRAALANAPAIPARSHRARSERRAAWLPLALAAGLLVAILFSHLMRRSLESPAMFRTADEKLAAFPGNFVPNVPSATLKDVSDAYRRANLPSHMWYFSASGFKLVGGRIESMCNGRPVTYTLYSNPQGAVILCMRFNGVPRTLPPGATLKTADHLFYH